MKPIKINDCTVDGILLPLYTQEEADALCNALALQIIAGTRTGEDVSHLQRVLDRFHEAQNDTRYSVGPALGVIHVL